MQLQYHGQRRGICSSIGSDECPPSLSWDFPTIALLSIVSLSFKHGILLYGSIGSLWIAYGSPCCPAWRPIVCSFHFACDSASQAEHPFHRWETTTGHIRSTQCSCPQKTGQPHPPSGALPWSRSLMCCYLHPVSEIIPTQDPGPFCIPAALAYRLYSFSHVRWCLHNQQAVINH